MANLYSVHPITRELTGMRELTDVDRNPKYNADTHGPDDVYIYNQSLATLIPPPAADVHKVAVFTGAGWEIFDDYRGSVFFDTETKEQHVITEIGSVPAPEWTSDEPTSIQTWNGDSWVDDFELWLNVVVRPARDVMLRQSDIYMLSDYPITVDEKTAWATYRQALRDLPSILTSIVDQVPWPDVPDES